MTLDFIASKNYFFDAFWQRYHVHFETDVSVIIYCKQIRLYPNILTASICYCGLCAISFAF